LQQVTADANLKNGFNAVGYSQGNLVIRGYVERYNDPPVHNFISMHGILFGVSGNHNKNTSIAHHQTARHRMGDALPSTLATTPCVINQQGAARGRMPENKNDKHAYAGTAE
jgi:hypothetical protein